MRYSFAGVSFINSLPFFCGKLPRDFDLHLSYPSALNELVRQSKSDVSMISRWVYPMCEAEYEVLPNFCIGGDGEIMSIKLFSKFDISEIDKGSIFITSQTGTSSLAFRKICLEKYAIDIFALKRAPLEMADSVILIGDNAMLFDSTAYEYSYDLGELWKDFAKCKMLYAVFVIRRNLFDCIAEKVSTYLDSSLAQFSKNPDCVYTTAMKLTGGKLPLETIKTYYSRLIFKMGSNDFKRSFNFVKDNGNI